MMYICPECGSEIPEDMAFCSYCGRKKDNTIRLDQAGHFVQPGANICSSCGSEMLPEDLFCPNCGERRSQTQLATFRPKMVGYGWVGLVLAIVPGVLGFIPDFNGVFTTLFGISMLPSIYGLGHLYFKRWGRGAMFIVFSAFLFYVRFTSEGTLDTNLWQAVFFQFISIFIFMLQTMEVFVQAYTPPKAPKTPEDGNDR